MAARQRTSAPRLPAASPEAEGPSTAAQSAGSLRGNAATAELFKEKSAGADEAKEGGELLAGPWAPTVDGGEEETASDVVLIDGPEAGLDPDAVSGDGGESAQSGSEEKDTVQTQEASPSKDAEAVGEARAEEKDGAMAAEAAVEGAEEEGAAEAKDGEEDAASLATESVGTEETSEPAGEEPPADGAAADGAAPGAAGGGAPATPAALGAPAGGGGGASSLSEGIPALSASVGKRDGATSGLLPDLWAAHTGQAPGEHEKANQALMAQAISASEDIKAGLRAEAASMASSLRAGVATRADAISAAANAAQSRAQSAFAAARSQVVASAQAARSSVQASADAAVAQIASAQDGQLSAASAGIDAQLTSVDGVAAELATGLRTDLQARADEARQMGVEYAALCRSEGSSMASGFRGRGSEDIEVKRNNARADAVTQVAGQYAPQLEQAANDAAAEISSALGQVDTIVANTVDPARADLASIRTALTDGITQTAAGAEAQVQQQRGALVQSIDGQEAKAVSQLEGQESRVVDGLGSRGEEAATRLRARGEEAVMQLESAEQNLEAGFDAELVRLQEELGVMDMPRAEDLEPVLAEVMARLEARRTELHADLEAARTQIEGRVNQAADRAIAGLGESAAAAASSAAELAGGVGTALTDGASQGGTQLSTIASDVSSALADQVRTGLSQAADRVGQARDQGGQARGEAVGKVADGVTQLRTTLDEQVAQMRGKASQEAEAAAAKIKKQPWWKKALATVVKVVITVATVAAITALMASGIGIGAALALCFVIGAAGGALSVAADQFIGGEDKGWRDYALGGLIGGLGGLVGGGAAAMTAAKVTPFLQNAVTGFAGSGIDQISDVLLKGESFNLLELLVTGTLNTVFLGAFDKFGKGPLTAWFKKKAFPGPNSWNTFQSQLARISPVALSSTTRSKLYSKVTKLPAKQTKKVIKKITAWIGENLTPDDAPKQEEDAAGSP